jgi:2-oxoglutarate ferredoxin oxidoreductase subunit beta
VWIITGDGDALSIGGNHLIHALRRNLNVPILLFNNEIYGLTKGQFSPTSKEGQVTKSTPRGSVDHPLNPLTLALGAGATWVARSMDRSPAHLRDQLAASQAHQGSALLEIYQNCNVFHDGAFEAWTDKSSQAMHAVFLEDGKPIAWGGTEPSHALAWNGGRPEIRELGSEFSLADAWVHDPCDRLKAFALAALEGPLRPFGVLYATERPVFAASHQAGIRPLHEVLHSGRTWTVE